MRSGTVSASTETGREEVHVIAVMLTAADNEVELGLELKRWLAHYGEPPVLILGPRDLGFSLTPHKHDLDEVTSQLANISVVDLSEFLRLHAAQLDPD